MKPLVKPMFVGKRRYKSTIPSEHQLFCPLESYPESSKEMIGAFAIVYRTAST